MNQQMKDDLRDCWQRVKDDPDIWVAIITGAGRAFSSGADVEVARRRRLHQDRSLARARACTRASARCRRRAGMHVHKPVIAAVNGVVGGRVARPRDRVRHPDRVGQGLLRRPARLDRLRLVARDGEHGAARAGGRVCLRMALLGNQEKMSAQRAYEVGLVTEGRAARPAAWRAPASSREMLCKNAPLAVWGTEDGHPARARPADRAGGGDRRRVPRGGRTVGGPRRGARARSSRSASRCGRRAENQSPQRSQRTQRWRELLCVLSEFPR